MTNLSIDSIGPLATLQDMGREGFITFGLSRGGAMDRLALYEAAALLGLPAPAPAIEMAGRGGTFRCDTPLRFALTGAQMQATIDGHAIPWAASHSLHPGQTLTIGGTLAGTWGYLTPAAPILAPQWRDSVSVHLAAGIGGTLSAPSRLLLGKDPAPDHPTMTLTPEDRFAGGILRLMPGPQTHLFDVATRGRFEATHFTRSAIASRQGARLDQTGEPFFTKGAAGLISDFIGCGDVQMTGNGVPYILMSESQTIGGYPRIGTVIAADLPRAAQAPFGAPLRFTLIDIETADSLFTPASARLTALRRQCRPLTRHPGDVPDLLTLNLISGIASANHKDQP